MRQSRGTSSTAPRCRPCIHHAPLPYRWRRGPGGQIDTAYSYRDSNWAEVIVGVDPTRPTRQNHQWCNDYFDALHPYSAGGAYVNFMMDEGQERVGRLPGNYERLAQIKSKYDPATFPCKSEYPARRLVSRGCQGGPAAARKWVVVQLDVEAALRRHLAG